VFHDAWDEGHEPSEHGGGKKTSYDTENLLNMPYQLLRYQLPDSGTAGIYIRYLVDPSQKRQRLQDADLRDDTNNPHRNSPEDDEDGDQSVHDILPYDDLPPWNRQVRPDNLIRMDSDFLRRHGQAVVVGENLVGNLCLVLRVELDKDCCILLEVACSVVSLSLFRLRDQSQQFSPAPVDGVDFLAPDAKWSKAVRRTHLVVYPI
jgi:hypothetical protein